MSARQGMQRLGLGTALLVMASTASVGTAMAIEKTPAEEAPLVQQCYQKAVDSGEDPNLEGKSLKDSNYPDYEEGKEYELRLSYLGHGNTYHNVTCQVDEQGNVTFEEVTQEGLPSLGS
jgi:uncharacterized protein YxeA